MDKVARDLTSELAGGMAGELAGAAAGSETTFILALFWGLIGMAYFVYGKKQSNAIALGAGIGLMFFPYFVSNAWISAAV
jgi:hypothetical protein